MTENLVLFPGKSCLTWNDLQEAVIFPKGENGIQVEGGAPLPFCDSQSQRKHFLPPVSYSYLASYLETSLHPFVP